VGYDQPDDPDVPPDKPPDRPARRAQPETRNLEEYYADLRAAVALQEHTEPATRSEPCARSKPADQQAEPDTGWAENAKLSRWMWTEYKRRWPPEEHPPVDRSADPPGSWRGDSNRFLDRVVNERIEAECDRIAEREREKITPALRETESQDPDRYLIGLERCLKGRDRIKEKVYDNMEALSVSSDEALSIVPDAIRYSFQYEENQYTRGVRADITRLTGQGFKLDKLKNCWSDDQYKGINSQWTESGTGQRIEVQFHTRISYEAKQITHYAYERLRTMEADKLEELVLEAFQNKVTAAVPIPPDATDIPDYPKRGSDGR
jgi:hypothetical protein